MMPDLVVERLSAQQVRLAFPLMRLAIPALTLAAWLRFARRTATANPSANKGILVVRRRGNPHLCGVVCYRRDHDLQAGSVLTAEHFVAQDLLHPRTVLAALASALEGVAACLGCRAVRSVLHAASPKLAEDLKISGHVLQGVVLERGLPTIPARN